MSVDFQERFKERTTFMNKTGVIGIVSQASKPIEKTPSSRQLSYTNESHQTQFKESRLGFSDYAAMSGMASNGFDIKFVTGTKNSHYGDSISTSRVYSRASVSQDNSPLVRQKALSRSLSVRDASEELQKVQINEKRTVQSHRRRSSTNEPTTKPPETPLVITNIQNPKQLQKFQQQQQLRELVKQAIPNSQQPRVRVASNLNQNSQNLGPVRPVFSIIPSLHHAKGFENNSTMNFENPYVNKYQDYEYNTIQYQGPRVMSKQIQYHTHQRYFAQYSQNREMSANPNPNGQSFESRNLHMPKRSLTGSMGELKSVSVSYDYERRPTQNGDHSNTSSPIPGSKGQMADWRTEIQPASGAGQSRGMSQVFMNNAGRSLSQGELPRNTEPEKKVLSNFKPYTLKNYRRMKEQTIANSHRGGLGPNIGSEEWKARAQKVEKMNLYAENTRMKNMQSSRLPESFIESARENGSIEGSLREIRRVPTGNSVDLAGLSRQRSLSNYEDWTTQAQRQRLYEVPMLGGRVVFPGLQRRLQFN